MLSHFLNNIRQLENLVNISNKNQRMNNRSEEDFKLAQCFLDMVYKGVSLNLITFWTPNKVYINEIYVNTGWEDFQLMGGHGHGKSLIIFKVKSR